MIKRIFGAVVALLCVALLSSCSIIGGTSGTIIDDSGLKAGAQMQHIADAVKNHDATALRKLFSPLARAKAPDLDTGLKYFLSFFPSDRLTWESEGVGSAEEDKGGKQTAVLSASYKVTANGKKYDLHFVYFPVNQVENTNNVGIYALGITPYSANPDAPGATARFWKWAATLGMKNGKTIGTPGIYVPRN